MSFNLSTIIRLAATCLASLAICLSISLDQSPTDPKQWDVNVTITGVVVGLLLVSAALAVLRSRLFAKREGKSLTKLAQD